MMLSSCCNLFLVCMNLLLAKQYFITNYTNHYLFTSFQQVFLSQEARMKTLNVPQSNRSVTSHTLTHTACISRLVCVRVVPVSLLVNMWLCIPK